MLRLVKDSLIEFENAKLKFCSWKNNQEIDLAINGASDLDLLVAFEQRYLFCKLVNKLGYKEATNQNLSYPNIKHFYGLDSNSGAIVHIHVYFRLTTGESHVKNYRFPFEAKILSSRITGPHGIPVPSPEWQQVLYLLRHYIKVSCLPGFLLFLREKTGYIDEFQFVGFPNNDANPIGSEVLGADFYETLQRNLNPWKSYLRQILLGMFLRHRIRHMRRISVASTFIQRYRQIFYRLINKLLLRQKKRLVNGGVFIAITGLDGSGKSTLVNELQKWLAQDLEVKTIHIGRPNSRIITLPINLLLLVWKKLRQTPHDQPSRANTESANKTSTFLQAARYYTLALDRYRVVLAGRKHVDRGCIVIADRYPSLSIGKMDSPRIVATETSSRLLHKLAEKERDLYKKMGSVDLLLRLSVPVEVAIERNRNRVKENKESDNEIRQRYEINQSLDYGQNNLVEFDTDCDYAICIRQVKSLIWKTL